MRGGHDDALGHPRRGSILHPIRGFEAGFKFVDLLNRAVRPFGFYLPMFAVFEDHTEYRSSRRHAFTYIHHLFGTGASDRETLLGGSSWPST